MPVALTIFAGRAGDHNDLAMPGAVALGSQLHERLGLVPVTIGAPAPALNQSWSVELDAAMPTLREMSARLDDVLRRGMTPLSALNRCAVALSTLPVVARYHPDAVVVWFDAHADINTPSTSPTGYLGGLALSGPLGWWDTGLGAGLSADNVVLVGTRDIDPGEQAILSAGTIQFVPAGACLAEELRAAVAGRPVYVHIDCDVLEPGIVPTDYLVPGGLSLDDLLAASRVLASTDVVGLEIGEFQASFTPAGPPHSPAALVDALTPLLAALD